PVLAMRLSLPLLLFPILVSSRNQVEEYRCCHPGLAARALDQRVWGWFRCCRYRGRNPIRRRMPPQPNSRKRLQMHYARFQETWLVYFIATVPGHRLAVYVARAEPIHDSIPLPRPLEVY